MNYFSALCLALLAVLPVRAQWTTQSPVPTDLDIRGIAAPTADHVFIATADDSFDDGGALFETTDGGATWVQRDVPTDLNTPLNGVFFHDAQHGWVFGNAAYRTTDGGVTWEELPLLGSVYGMDFYTPTFGRATTNGGPLVTRDGGLSWEASPNGLFAFDFASDQVGLGVSAEGIFRSTDGGTTFALVQPAAEVEEGEETEEDGAKAVVFLSGIVAVAIMDGTFWRSSDGGQTWTQGATAEGRTRLEVVTPEVVLAWGQNFYPNSDARLLRSDDSGQTWTDLGDIIGTGSGAFAASGNGAVVAMDSYGNVLQSSDAGLTWMQTFTSPDPLPSAFSAIAPSFPTAQTGYLGYGEGFVIKTTDGGQTWSQISSGYGATLNDLDRFADGRLIAVGERGTILTSSGAVPWRLHETFTNLHLSAVDVIGPNDVVTVDEEGRVYRSADGGETWTAGAAAPPGLDARDLYFTSPLDGWVIGSGFSSGALFHTTDGGDSWTPVDDFAGGYVAVDFDGTRGWAANSGARYYYTHDGGVTWTQGDLPGFPFQIRDMDFADGNVGYAVGWDGYAARSVDGGVTWDVLPFPAEWAEDDLTDLYLLGPDELWVSTNQGRAYYSATGGQNWTVLDSETEGFGSFAAIAATTEGRAWMVGFQGYIEHFSGTLPPPLNRPPVAAYTFSTQGLTVTFTDGSSDPDGTVEAWAWDFGDSTPNSTEQSPTHTFTEADTYHVRLTVTDDDGATSTTVRFIAVQPNPGGTFGDFTEVTPLDAYFVTPQNEDFWVTTAAPADYDGDGDLDIAVFGFYVVYNESVEETLLLLRNDGLGDDGRWDFTYLPVPIGDLTSGASDLAWGDLDNDGDQDLVVGTNGVTVVFRNDDGALTATETDLPGYFEDNLQADFDLRSITLADYDNDGDLDLLLPSVLDPGAFDHRTALLRNEGLGEDGSWTFTEVDAGFAPTFHAQSAWADDDGDGDLDLLLVHVAPLTDEGFIRRYRNDGGGTFVGEDLLGGLTLEHGEAQWGDYDSDGDLDLLVAGRVGEVEGGFNVVLRVYRNDAGTFAPIEIIDSPAADGWLDLNAATWADYDTDGDVDILLAGTYNSGGQIDGRARVYDNDGGTFTDTGNDLPAPRSSGSRGGTFSWLDFDGEGDLDYFIAGQYFVPGGNGLVEAQMHVYRNDSEGSNAAPTPPTGLVATPDAQGRVVLSWDAASDDTTPVEALTYDLELHREEAPVAVPRRLPESGSVSAVTGWVFTDLADGTYTWTVRAVDNAFNGSAFADGTFVVGTVATEPDAVVPRAYAFEQNYPNPFLHATTLRFALPEDADVDLAVYDLMGRRVARIASEQYPAGYHEIEWKARGLASGTYLARFATDTFTATRRVLVVR